MSAYTAAALNEFRALALKVGAPMQMVFCRGQYRQARSVTPPLVVAWHDVTGLLLGRVTLAQRRRLIAPTVDVDATKAERQIARLRIKLRDLEGPR